MIKNTGFEHPGAGREHELVPISGIEPAQVGCEPSSTNSEGNGLSLSPAMLDLGGRGPLPPAVGVPEYLSRLARCGATVGFSLCPAALGLLCELAGALRRSGAPIGQISEAAEIRSRTTRAAALRMLVAFGLVSVDRVHGKGGEVRGSRWKLLSPPTDVPSEARALINEIIERRIERTRRIAGKLPGERIRCGLAQKSA
jgi:hypothetical protein